MSHTTPSHPPQLWKPLPDSGHNIKRLIQRVRAKHDPSVCDYDSLWKWSTNPVTAPLFWLELFDFLKIKADMVPDIAYERQERTVHMFPPPRFFPSVKMNFAENIFKSSQSGKTILHLAPEGSEVVRDVTWDELYRQVSQVSSAMAASGIKVGDRVAAVISNRFETIVCCLATLSLGAIWSTSSPDMGVDGILDRLKQIQPRLVFCESHVIYNGKSRDLMQKHHAWTKTLSATDTELDNVIVISDGKPFETNEGGKMITWEKFTSRSTNGPLTFKQLPFSHPGFIVYSSGTSGLPKCIVHSAGGLLLQVRKDSILSYDVRPGDTILQYTTTGWIMWAMVLVSLSYGGKVVIYDGSPMVPDNLALFRLVEKLGVNLLGTSAKFLSLLMTSNTNPREHLDLSSLRTITSTGSTLTPQVAKWFYDAGFPPHIHLVSTCGGTDLAASLITGAGTLPLHAGEIQSHSLGMAVDIFDLEDEDGKSIKDTGAAGELVCTQPFPSQPVCFWGDKDGERYRTSYFEQYGNRIWQQGDFVSRNPATGGYLTHGRSDGVLNPAGVRFGSAEIYHVVEQHPEVADSLCVGQRRPQDPDESVVLFVQMVPGAIFTPPFANKLQDAIRVGLSPRHVPKYVFQVPDIPHTVNGKKIEILVKKIISGEKPKISPTVANPECLDFYKQFISIEEAATIQGQTFYKSHL
ncbi:hypothetical protein FDECE_223 [Fusarium decemcellulare]|nr:hypothetical protein FDECE_223 [Fusarium decemcellulare]